MANLLIRDGWDRQSQEFGSIKKVSEKWGIGLRRNSKRCVVIRDGIYPIPTLINERRAWIKEICGSEVYETFNCNAGTRVYYFQNISDAVLFKLRWK